VKQLLLFPDERPLVELLGAEFFREAPQCPGVYLMRNVADEVLYVGKAKNLRKRLGSYRVANPERLRRRHLRLLRSVARIEFHACDSEDSALAKESALLRSLRPRFNRAGTWPAPPRYMLWRLSPDGFDLAVRTTVEREWFSVGPLGGSALPLRNLLLRILWCGVFPERGLAGMPPGWFRGSLNELITIPLPKIQECEGNLLPKLLAYLWKGEVEHFAGWIARRSGPISCPFEAMVRAADLEVLMETVTRRNQGTS